MRRSPTRGVDAVILCTPQDMHTGQMLAAARAGKHVFCGKPLAMTRADAEASVAACRAAGVMLGVGHERRFEPAMRRLREMLRAGRLGTILHLEANFSHDKLRHIKPGDRRADPRNPAAFTGMGIHLTDAFPERAGPATEVYAAAARLVPERPNGDIVSVQLRLAPGATAFAGAILETPLYIGFRVFGSEGRAEIRNATHPDTPGLATLTVQPRGAPETEEFAWENAALLNLQAFARGARRGRLPVHRRREDRQRRRARGRGAIGRDRRPGAAGAMTHPLPDRPEAPRVQLGFFAMPTHPLGKDWRQSLREDQEASSSPTSSASSRGCAAST